MKDMWLTGFDAPVLHTLYIDKPMRDHGLLQAIARVNRVFEDKPGGLVVDYIGIGEDLRASLRAYDDADLDDPVIPACEGGRRPRREVRGDLRAAASRRLSPGRAPPGDGSKPAVPRLLQPRARGRRSRPRVPRCPGGARKLVRPCSHPAGRDRATGRDRLLQQARCGGAEDQRARRSGEPGCRAGCAPVHVRRPRGWRDRRHASPSPIRTGPRSPCSQTSSSTRSRPKPSTRTSRSAYSRSC